MKAFWSILFSLFFLGVVSATFVFLSEQGSLRTEIPWGDLILLSLATFRLVRLFTYDHITDFLRVWVRNGKTGTFIGTVRDLLGCPWCTGVWFGFLTYAAYCFSREMTMPVILVLAIAALASVFQIFTNLVGWNAEDKKLDVAHKAD